jgi:hypothetical protein
VRPIPICAAAVAALVCSSCTDTGSPTSAAPRPNPAAAASRDEGSGAEGLSASGRYHFSVPPNVFGTTTPVDARFNFSVRKRTDGTVDGDFVYHEAADGSSFRYTGSFTCFNVYDFDGLVGNRAKVGGVVETSTDPSVPPGSFIWWQAIDDRNGDDDGVPGKSTLGGVGDAAANAAFCASSNPPRFGPFAIHGRISVGSEK